METNGVKEIICYKFDEYLLDKSQNLLFNQNGDIIPVGQKALECLLLLIENPFKLVSKDEFFEKIWKDSFVEDAVLAVNISHLRKILSENKSDTTFIETVPRKGYIFVLEVEIIKQNIEVEPETDDFLESDIVQKETNPLVTNLSPEILDFQPEVSQVKKLNKRRFLLPIIIFVGLIGGTFLFYKGNINSKTDKVSLVIFPLENLTGDQNLDYLSIRIPDSLNYQLSNAQSVQVKPTTSIRKYVGQPFNPVEEGKLMGVENIVTGSFRKKNDGLIVSLQVTNISKPIPTTQQQQFEISPDNLDALPNLMFQFLSNQLNLSNTN